MDHGYPNDHTVPHIHKTEYNVQYPNGHPKHGEKGRIMAMRGFDKAQDAIGEFRFPEFRLLRELRVSITPDDGRCVTDVHMCLETESRQPRARLCVRFHQVSSLQIRNLGGEARIQGFDIADLSDRQLENIRWQVFDFEDEVIGFYALDAEITSASILDIA